MKENFIRDIKILIHAKFDKEWHSDWSVWKGNVIQINHPRYGEESAMDGISWMIDILSDAELKVENKLSAIVLRRV